MAKEGKKKMIVLVAVLAVLLVGALAYVAVDIYSDARNNRELGIYREAATYGYETAVTEIMSLADSCQVVPLTYMNQTMELVNVACLQQAQE